MKTSENYNTLGGEISANQVSKGDLVYIEQWKELLLIFKKAPVGRNYGFFYFYLLKSRSTPDLEGTIGSFAYVPKQT